MKRKIHIAILYLFALCIVTNHAKAQSGVKMKDEMHRPQIHFSQKAHWINDPNGMVYLNGTYHLFFQYYPESTVWGPMHWGHATSKDLIHWKELPIALYPDSLGYIFSGSAVIDKNNTSGFGKNGKAPMVAIFTHHNPVFEKENRDDVESQSIAYSLDEGKTWTKYAANPVVKNPGIKDFRDPKVMWYEPQKKWVMTLATKDRITFYSSPNLKDWTKESEFGEQAGAHGGVWECPDLFTLDHNGKKVWVLIVNINPGGPNGGSATQYFVGNFDGKNFTASHTDTRWVDYGPDEYAGITWGNTGNRKIFLGWMSNWQYSTLVPTKNWRGAMTLPRELKLKQVGKDLLIASEPVKELAILQTKKVVADSIDISAKVNLATHTGSLKLPCRINLSMENTNDFSLTVSNDLKEKLVIGFNKKKHQFFIDRTASGKIDFEKGFAGVHAAPRFSADTKMTFSLVIDVSSLELFADDGLTVMTETFFPHKPYSQVYMQSKSGNKIAKLEYMPLSSIWK